VQVLWLGGKDLSEALGCTRTAVGLAAPRASAVHAAALAGLPALDDVYRPFDDLQGLAASCAQGREVGFRGKVTVDARQVDIINASFGAVTGTKQ